MCEEQFEFDKFGEPIVELDEQIVVTATNYPQYTDYEEKENSYATCK